MRAGQNVPPVFIMKYIAIGFTIFILVVILLADRGQLGFLYFIYDFPYGDKLGHFILYGLLNFFLTRAFLSSGRTSSRNRVAFTTGLILAVLIGAEEWSQQFFSTRTFSLMDLLASYLGLIAGGWAALKIKRP